MAYADYEYYTSAYLGDLVPEDAFPRCAERASEYISYLAQNRVPDEPPEAVKRCCCAVAELEYLTSKAKGAAADGGEVKSESNGSWSQSYITAGDYVTMYEGQKAATARRYLAPTGLLYRGLC